MRNLSKIFLLIATILFGATAFAAPRPAAAAPSGVGQAYGNQTVTCSSDDGNRHHCDMNTGGGAQLVQQISGTPCVQGQSWGVDGRGVWVDHGCRATFASGGGQPAQTLTCSSDDGKRHYCGANVGAGVQLSRQISGTPCIQGQSWGYDNQGVWVDHGCRAEFATGGYNNGYGNGYGNGFGNGQGQPGQTITCSSDDGKRHYCGVGTGGGVQLTQQISGTPCIQGQTWGYDNQGVWVDRGCRAQFTTGGNGYRRFGQGQGQTITCSSDDGNRHWCTTNVNGGRAHARMTRQISGSPCIEGQTWGVDRRGLWVDRGCRAEFQVR